MRILFFKAKNGGIWDRLYSIIDMGRYSRVEIEFTSGRTFGVDLESGRLIFDPLPFRMCDWEAVDLPVNEQEVRRWCDSMSGFRLYKKSWMPKILFSLIKPYLIRVFAAYELANILDYSGYDKARDVPTINGLHTFLLRWLSCHKPPYYAECELGCDRCGKGEVETLFWD